MAVYLPPQQRDRDVPHPHVIALTDLELLELARLVDAGLRGDPVVLTHAPEALLRAAALIQPGPRP